MEPLSNVLYTYHMVRSGSRKKYGGGLAPHHLGGNNEQNYCVQLSSIKQLMYHNYPEHLGWACAPPGPNIELPLHTVLYFSHFVCDKIG